MLTLSHVRERNADLTGLRAGLLRRGGGSCQERGRKGERKDSGLYSRSCRWLAAGTRWADADCDDQHKRAPWVGLSLRGNQPPAGMVDASAERFSEDKKNRLSSESISRPSARNGKDSEFFCMEPATWAALTNRTNLGRDANRQRRHSSPAPP
jgi:hypothetical protein